MGLNKSAAFALTLVLGLGAAAMAQDSMAPDPMDAQAAVDAREKLMKSFGAPLRGLNSIVDPQAMVELATMYVDGFESLEALFPVDSIVPGSKALPAIWENWDEFVVEIDKARVLADEFLVAAETGDQAIFLDAARGLGPVCRDCHDHFRASMR